MNGKRLKIGIVQARFNSGVTDALAQACKDELLALGVSDKDIDHINVPGALEVALALQAMAVSTGFPFTIVLLVATVAVVKGLMSEPRG